MRIQVNLTDRQIEWLDEQAKALQISRSEFLRRIIDSQVPPVGDSPIIGNLNNMSDGFVRNTGVGKNALR